MKHFENTHTELTEDHIIYISLRFLLLKLFPDATDSPCGKRSVVALVISYEMCCICVYETSMVASS